jgi:transposase
MSSIPVFVGLDYHQTSVQVCVLNREGRLLWNRSVSNDAGAVQSAIVRHGRAVRVAIEACCGAADLAEELATRHGLPVELAHPGYVARLKQSPDKHDFGDAHLLGDLSRVNYLPKVWLAPAETRQLRRLMRHRQQLVARRRETKLRIRALLRENRLQSPEQVGNPWTKAWLAWLEQEAPCSPSDRFVLEDHLAELKSLTERIRRVEGQLQARVAEDPVVAKLLTYEGIGLITAATLRAEIGRFERFRTGKQLARFCGVTPRNASSGQRQADAGLIRAGNPELRAVLIELAHRQVGRLQGRWSTLAAKLLRSGKPKNVVIAAVANRFIRWLYYQMIPAPPTTSAPARQKGPPLPPSPSPRPRRRVKAEATAKAEGARGRP